MSKGLDALKELKKSSCAGKFCPQSLNYCQFECPNSINEHIIEQELKALEIIKCLLFGKCRIYETSEKATATTITKGDFYVVELELNNKRYYLSKEEYELLKEVLTND